MEQLNAKVYTVHTGSGDKSFIASSIWTNPLTGDTILFDGNDEPCGIIPKGFLIIPGKFLPSADRSIKELKREEVENTKSNLNGFERFVINHSVKIYGCLMVIMSIFGILAYTGVIK